MRQLLLAVQEQWEQNKINETPKFTAEPPGSTITSYDTLMLMLVLVTLQYLKQKIDYHWLGQERM